MFQGDRRAGERDALGHNGNTRIDGAADGY